LTGEIPEKRSVAEPESEGRMSTSRKISHKRNTYTGVQPLYRNNSKCVWDWNHVVCIAVSAMANGYKINGM